MKTKSIFLNALTIGKSLFLTLLISSHLYADRMIFEGGLDNNGQNMNGTHRIQLGFLKPDTSTASGFSQNAVFIKDISFSTQGDFVFELTHQEIENKSIEEIF